MTTRSGDFTNVRYKGNVIGFVKGPDRYGLWSGYCDYEHKAGSTLIGTFNKKDEAVAGVYKASGY